jgi:hypothetical protein
MAGVAFGAFIIYWLIKKNPKKANDMIATSNEYLKYLPLDSGTTKYLSPILDFTSKSLGGAGAVAGASAYTSSYYGEGGEEHPILSLGGLGGGGQKAAAGIRQKSDETIGE